MDFFLVLAGFVEIYERGPDGTPQVMTVHAERQFTGELDLFTDRAILVGGRMGADGRVARLGRAQFRRLLAADPDVADVVMRAFILRRTGGRRRRRPGLLATSLPGVFAVGDVRADSIKRVASAVGEGSIVISSVHEALHDG